MVFAVVNWKFVRGVCKDVKCKIRQSDTVPQTALIRLRDAIDKAANC